MNKNKILYDSDYDVENDKDDEIEEVEPVSMPQDEIKEAPLFKIKPKKNKKITIKQPVKNWNEFLNDDIEKPQKTEIKENEELFTCKFCNKSYKRVYHLNRHLEDNRCTVKRDIDKRRGFELDEMEKAIMLKLQKKELNKEKKIMKQRLTIKEPIPIKPKAIKQPVIRKQAQPKQQEPTIYKPQNNNVPKYIINF